MKSDLKFECIYNIEQYRNGKLLRKFQVKNLITTEGKNTLLDVFLKRESNVAAWYMGLVSTGGDAAVVGDTYASHGFLECSYYDQSGRPAWTPAAASSGSCANATPIQFDINQSDELSGIFLCSHDAKGDDAESGAVLFSVANFSSAIDVIANDDLKITYTVGVS